MKTQRRSPLHWSPKAGRVNQAEYRNVYQRRLDSLLTPSLLPTFPNYKQERVVTLREYTLQLVKLSFKSS